MFISLIKIDYAVAYSFQDFVVASVYYYHRQ